MQDLLGIFFLSDITLSDGVGIDPRIIAKQKQGDRKSRWIWPKQTPPSNIMWKQFFLCLDLIWTKNSDSYIVNPHLGSYTCVPHQCWTTFYSPETSLIYVKDFNTFSSFERWNFRV